MTISRVGVSKALGDTIAWASGHARRDLAIVFAHATGSTIAITPPSGWYTVSALINTQSRAIFYCWADSAAMANATFANAEFLHMWVGRGSAAMLTVGGFLSQVNTGVTTWTYNGFTVHNWQAASLVLLSACSAATDNTAYTTAPTGATLLDSQRDTVTQIGQSNLFESGLVSAWSSVNVTGTGTANVIHRLGIEVFEMPQVFGGMSRPSHPFLQQVIG
jgi:hypothetical protein